MTDAMTEDRKKCGCPTCLYGAKIRDLIHRTPSEDDKKLIEELYENLICAEDDRDYWKIRHGELRKTSGSRETKE